MIIEHEKRIYLECEALINSMIDNLSNTRLQFEVYGDELSRDEWYALQENMRGYAAAIKVIIDNYREVTPLADRAEVMLGLSEQIQSIMEAPCVAHL